VSYKFYTFKVTHRIGPQIPYRNNSSNVVIKLTKLDKEIRYRLI